MKYNVTHEITDNEGKPVLGANYPHQTEEEARKFIYRTLVDYSYPGAIVFEFGLGELLFDSTIGTHKFTISEDKSGGTIPLASKLKLIEVELLSTLRTAFQGIEDTDFDFNINVSRGTVPYPQSHPLMHYTPQKAIHVNFSVSATIDA